MSLTKVCRCCELQVAGDSTEMEELLTQCQPPHDTLMYGEMLTECFGLHLSQAVVSRAVCAGCVVRLSAAWEFRLQVVRTERSLVQLATTGDNLELCSVKAKDAQMLQDDSRPEDSGGSHHELCWSDSEKPSIKRKPLTKAEFTEDEKISLSALLPKKLTTKDAAVKCKEIQGSKDQNTTFLGDNRIIKAVEEKNVKKANMFSKKVKMSPKNAAKLNIADKKTGTQRKRGTTIFTPISFKGITVKPKTYNLQPIRTSADAPRPHKDNPTYMTEANAALIIELSNVCPFKCKYNEYFCFYCNRSFYEPQLLRDHTRTEHRMNGIRRLVRFNHLTKVDVTEVDCKLCTEQITDLNALKNHLTAVHKKTFFMEASDGVLPFRLSKDNLRCALCTETFPYFHAVNQHMNDHFPNFVCETCGLGFVEESRLQVHKSKHDTKTFPCETCGKEFRSVHARKGHVDRVHDRRGRIYCPVCPEKFLSHEKKLSHLTNVHGKTQETFKCAHCDRTFMSRRLATLHTRKEHLRDFRYECTYCGRKFFTKTSLSNHVPTHTGERNHKCAVCGKAYPREKALKEHMRIHNNDKRFACSVCGQAFVQNGSLKSHVKTHHPECGGL